jgi:3-oxoacyl-[acyl-carrier-protein] synthase-3
MARTGIKERRHAGKDETTASMSIAAAQLALDRARISPSAVDLIIVATFSPDHIFPSTACLVQDALGANHAGAFDLSAACSGFIYALSMGADAIRAGSVKTALVIGSETVSRFLDKKDRGTYPLFGDGAGAFVLQASEVPGGILATVLGSDGSGAEHLMIPAGGSKYPACQDTLEKRMHYMHMNGREVYRFATRVMGRVAKQACEKAGVILSEVDLLIPHQANIRIIQSASKSLKISDDKVFTNLERYGNTSAASIPLALCEAIEQGRIHEKDKLVMIGFGGGLTWGATVVEWGVPVPAKPRSWGYRTLRWMLYRWAKVRSWYIRTLRSLENLLPSDPDGYLPPQPLKTEEPEEKITESSSNDNGHNGNGKGNGKTDHALESPTEVPLKKVLEAEEKVLEPERTVE